MDRRKVQGRTTETGASKIERAARRRAKAARGQITPKLTGRRRAACHPINRNFAASVQYIVMRQRLGKRKVKKYREQTGLDVVAGLVRGGTNHRVDLCISDGSVVYLWPDGTTEKADGLNHRQPSVFDSIQDA